MVRIGHGPGPVLVVPLADLHEHRRLVDVMTVRLVAALPAAAAASDPATPLAAMLPVGAGITGHVASARRDVLDLARPVRARLRPSARPRVRPSAPLLEGEPP